MVTDVVGMVGLARAQAPEELEPADQRHPQVENDGVRRPRDRDGESRFRVRRRLDAIALQAKHPRERQGDAFVIVDDEHGLCWPGSTLTADGHFDGFVGGAAAREENLELTFALERRRHTLEILHDGAAGVRHTQSRPLVADGGHFPPHQLLTRGEHVDHGDVLHNQLGAYPNRTPLRGLLAVKCPKSAHLWTSMRQCGTLWSRTRVVYRHRVSRTAWFFAAASLSMLTTARNVEAAPCVVATEECTEWVRVGGGTGRSLVYRTYAFDQEGTSASRAR